MARRCTPATPIGVGLIMWSVCVAAPVSGSTLLVSNTFDHGPGSLRDAIASAAPGDTIQASVGGAITLTGGPLVVRQDLSIVGPGAASLTIAGSGSSRVFTVDVAIVSISGVTISNGRSDYGGAILSGGRMTLTDCVLSSNAAAMFGGAIFNSGTLTLVRSLVSNNVAEYRAGAIYSETGSTLTLDHATLSGNSSSVGGAIDHREHALGQRRNWCPRRRRRRDSQRRVGGDGHDRQQHDCIQCRCLRGRRDLHRQRHSDSRKQHDSEQHLDL